MLHLVQGEHERALRNAASGKRGVVGPAEAKIMYNGWSTQHASPFRDLLWMRRSFYQCFGICLLHIEFLGLVKVRYHFLVP